MSILWVLLGSATLHRTLIAGFQVLQVTITIQSTVFIPLELTVLRYLRMFMYYNVNTACEMDNFGWIVIAENVSCLTLYLQSRFGN